MSDLANKKFNAGNLHRHLMATASALALIASACGIESALARDSDTPTVWIELGGQLERIESSQPSFSPPFIQNAPDTTAPVSPAAAQRPPQYANGAEGKLSFEPAGTDLLFSAGIRYGRSNGGKHIHQRTQLHSSFFGQYPYAFTDVRGEGDEGKVLNIDLTLDFRGQARILGLGMFGEHGQSALKASGVRYAQFSSRADVRISNNPTSNPYNFRLKLILPGGTRGHPCRGHRKQLHWNRPIACLGWFCGDPGKRGHFSSRVRLGRGFRIAVRPAEIRCASQHASDPAFLWRASTTTHLATRTPSKSKVVPYRKDPGGGFGHGSRFMPNAKVTLGYRADFFLGAVDGGLDARQGDPLKFSGPFAAIGIGL